VTIDCDGQHQPRLIPDFIAAAADGSADIVSGSRYLVRFPGDSEPPAARRRINAEITAEINGRLGLALTDAFCGFKAYTRQALDRLRVREFGYAMPLEVWVQAAAAGLRIVELPVPLVYLDLARSFGGALDDAATRLAYYRSVLDRAEAAVAAASCPMG
jgi:dolichol-phosphate mannosyltransferase